MSGRQNETVTVEPMGVSRIEPHMPCPQHVSHCRATHRHPWVTAIRLLHGIDRETADRVNALGLKVGRNG